jgi:hypothetical protein
MRWLLAMGSMILALSACQTDRSHTGAPNLGVSTPPQPVASATLQQVLARAPADPVSAMPSQIVMQPMRGSWTSEVLGRTSDVIDTANEQMAGYMEPLTLQRLELPFILTVSGNDARGQQLTKAVFEGPKWSNAAQRAAERDQPITEHCAKIEPNCGSAILRRYEWSVVELARGDLARADYAVRDLEPGGWVRSTLTPSRCIAQLLLNCNFVFRARLGYLFQTGQHEEAHQAILDWHAFESDSATMINLIVQRHVTLLFLQGRWRDAMRAIDLITADQRLSFIELAPMLFYAWDNAIYRDLPLDIQIAIAGLAADLPGRYPTPGVNFRRWYAAELECRAAHTALLLAGDPAAVAQQFDAMLASYLGDHAEIYNLGGCLHALALKVGRAEMQEPIVRKMKSMRDRNVPEGEQRVINAANQLQQYLPNAAQASRSMARSISVNKNTPIGLFLVDETIYSDAAVTYLESTKYVEDHSLRANYLIELMDFLLINVLVSGRA